MKFRKLLTVLSAILLFSSLPVRSQPLEKPTEAELPHLSLEQLSEKVGGPTKVSLHFENADFSTVMKEASQKFNVPFALSARTGAKGPVTFDLKDAPLWTVWDTLRAQLQYDRTAPAVAPRGLLMLTTPLVERPNTTYETPLFQVRTQGVRQNDKGWTMLVYVVADPKVEVGTSSGHVHLTEAIDDQGNNLLDKDVRSSLLYQTMPSIYYSSLSQERPGKLGKRLAIVRGTISGYAVVEREKWELALADLPVEKTLARNGTTEIISAVGVQRDVDKDRERYIVEMSRAVKSLINYRFWDSTQTRLNTVYNYSTFASVQLQDAGGRKFYLRTTNADATYENEAYLYTWTGRFERAPVNRQDSDVQPQGEPAKLVWSVPTSIYRFEFPFELHDVPIN